MTRSLHAIPILIVSILLTAPGAAQGATFSIDFQGPTNGAPDAWAGLPITQGDILSVAVPGPPVNPPLPGPLPPPRRAGAIAGGTYS